MAAAEVKTTNPVLYSAVQRFDPTCGDNWTEFINWCGLTQLREVVSLDIILCPSVIVIDELTIEDWDQNVNEDFMCHLFYDPEYLRRKVVDREKVNILAILRNPIDEQVCAFNDARFDFRGFDLVEAQTGISALVNCGSFPKAFSSTDLSNCGLLTEHSNAQNVQRLLKAQYPDEHHADCELWAIWQMK